MAHPCFSCDGECYCHGDIDDCIVSLTPSNCESCGCEDEGSGRYDDNEDDNDFDDDRGEYYLDDDE